MKTGEQRFTIHPAAAADVAELARLFDQYRIFYKQRSDLRATEQFVAAQIQNGVTRFFLAKAAEEGALGFVHLIPSIGTLAMRPIWYLEDLFVAPPARRQGIARALMLHAEQFARESGAERLTLSTAHDNQAAQALYRSVGYVREEYFWQFNRRLS